MGQTLPLGLEWFEFIPPTGLISNHWYEITPVHDRGTWPKLVSLSKTKKKVWEVAQYFFGSIVVIINRIRLTKIMFFAFSIKKIKCPPVTHGTNPAGMTHM